MSTRNMTYEESHGRVPLIALDYNHRNLRKLREIMIDYTNGNLYVVSDTDIDTIFDLTKEIINKVSEGIIGDDIIVNIEGIGEINLSEFLNYLQNLNISSEPYGGGTLLPSLAFDNNSIGIDTNKIEIVDFAEAIEGAIPQKQNGRIVWVLAGIGSGNTSVTDANIENGVLALELNRVTKIDTNMPNNFTITMPYEFSGQLYGKTVLYLEIHDTVPTITFPGNVKMEYNTDSSLLTNCIALYEFETYNGGNIWLCKLSKWLNNPEIEITESYIHDKFDWKVVGEEE